MQKIRAEFDETTAENVTKPGGTEHPAPEENISPHSQKPLYLQKQAQNNII